MRKKRRTVADWLATPLGRLVTSTESELARGALEKAFGDVTLQIGGWGDPALFLQHSKTRRAHLVATYPSPGVDIVSAPAQLAVASDSVDAVVLPHTLELVERPRETLREVQRILVGDGRVILFCFDPFSLWGLGKKLGRIPSREDGQDLSIRRLADWLTLLGLEPTHFERYLYVPPLNHDAVTARAEPLARAGRRFWRFASGAFMVIAKKRVYSGMPLRQKWQRRVRVVGGLAEPTTRSAA